MFLMQQLDAKLSVVYSAVGRWEDEIGRLQHDVQSLQSDMNAKADRLEDKILDLGKDSNARTDRLEDKMESLKNNAIQKNHQLEDKVENLCTCLDAKIAQISQDGICDDHKYLASVWSGRFDSLEVLIQDKLQEMSFDMNLTALTTRCMLAAQSVQENTTDSAALKSVLTDLLKPKDCYKGMGSRASFTSSPYTVIEPSQDNSLAAPVLSSAIPLLMEEDGLYSSDASQVMSASTEAGRSTNKASVLSTEIFGSALTTSTPSPVLVSMNYEWICDTMEILCSLTMTASLLETKRATTS